MNDKVDTLASKVMLMGTEAFDREAKSFALVCDHTQDIIMATAKGIGEKMTSDTATLLRKFNDHVQRQIADLRKSGDFQNGSNPGFSRTSTPLPTTPSFPPSTNCASLAPTTVAWAINEFFWFAQEIQNARRHLDSRHGRDLHASCPLLRGPPSSPTLMIRDDQRIVRLPGHAAIQMPTLEDVVLDPVYNHDPMPNDDFEAFAQHGRRLNRCADDDDLPDGSPDDDELAHLPTDIDKFFDDSHGFSVNHSASATSSSSRMLPTSTTSPSSVSPLRNISASASSHA